MSISRNFAFEVALESDLDAFSRLGTVKLSTEDIREGISRNAIHVSMLPKIASHPNVPEEWAILVIEDPVEAGLEGDGVNEVHYALAENRNLPGIVLSSLLAEFPDGTLDTFLISNPHLPARALDLIVRRTAPTNQEQWSEFLYSYLTLVTAYEHPNITDDTGLLITHLFINIVDSDIDPDNPDYFVVTQSVTPTVMDSLAAAVMDPRREHWFTGEERSRILVARAIA